MANERVDFIHRFVPGQPAEGRTLLLLHGTGGNENDLLSLGPELLPGAALLSPRGQVLENGMPRFFRRLAEGVFDIEDLIGQTHRLADWVTWASGEYGIDPAQVVAVGYSNGANIAGSLLLLRPGVLAGAVLLRPMVPLVPESLPNLDGTPVFIGAGQFDPIASLDQTERLRELLSSAGATVTLAQQPSGHQLTRQDVAAAREWFGGLDRSR